MPRQASAPPPSCFLERSVAGAAIREYPKKDVDPDRRRGHEHGDDAENGDVDSQLLGQSDTHPRSTAPPEAV